MQTNIEMRIDKVKQSTNQDERNKLIDDYFPFLIRVVSDEMNAYVEVENSEELSVAIEAFNESIDRFEEERGRFLSFAELVVRSRVRNFVKSKYNDQSQVVYFDDLSHSESQNLETNAFNKSENKFLKEEIESFVKELSYFKMDIEDLVDEKPKHKDTHEKTKVAGKQISENDLIVTEMYKKKKLPISKVVNQLNHSIKFVKQWKKYILSIVIVYKKKYSSIIDWLEKK